MFEDTAYKSILPGFVDSITKNSSDMYTTTCETIKLFISVFGTLGAACEPAVYLYNNPNTPDVLERGNYIPNDEHAATDEALTKAAGYLSARQPKVPCVLTSAGIDAPGLTGGILAIPITAFDIIYGYVLTVFAAGIPAPDSPEAEFLARSMQLAALVYQKNKNDAAIDYNLATDYLTALPNREQIYEMIIFSLQMSELYATGFVLMIVRINGLKHINNALGIFTGDAALKQIGSMVKDAALVCGTQTEPFVGRLTGSDFAIIVNLGNVQDEDAFSIDNAHNVIKTCCEAIIHKIKDFIEVYGYKLYLSVNIGASVYPEHGATAEELIRKADLAKGLSKKHKPNSFEIYNIDMDGDVEKVMFLSNNLPDAIAQKQFVLFFQAQKDVVTGKIENAEALIRWNHPEKGMIFPGYFIEYAEENGYGIDLDLLVLEMVCDRINEWSGRGIKIAVSANISPDHFRDGLICDNVSRMLKSKGTDPAMLKIELLESALVENFEDTVNTITRLRGMGVSVALDDFGTGYSSLEYVLKLPLDYLKIDREFSMNLEKNPNNKILMETIMTLAKGMKVKSVVEGVENQYQYDYLKTIGADLAQGYFINKPVPADVFEELLK